VVKQLYQNLSGKRYRDLVNLKDLEPFVRIQKTSSILTGTPINYSQLAREAGVGSLPYRQRFL
jgi:hypothetical protein